MRIKFLFWAATFLLFIADPARAASVEVDFNQVQGSFRPLHGINKGPLVGGGLIDLTSEHKRLGIPLTRLHDCHWPNPDVVDIHVLFPNPDADPSHPSSYNFAMTDEYVSAVLRTGSKIVFRLGESIEHTTIKRFVHPPADQHRWAEICRGVIRHYNEGWANGFHHDIQYWEIWNEPENRPVMWSGTDEDYFSLYSIASRKIKETWPKLKVGGPSLGHSGSLVKEKFTPGDFLKNFLAICQRDNLPLDFLSWHCYTDQPLEFVHRAKGIRQILDQYGFNKTESHLNEWNYLPRNDWKPIMKGSSAEDRQNFAAEMMGGPGAAFVLESLLLFQNAPIDAANFFHGEIGIFGLFNDYGVRQQVFHAFDQFNRVARLKKVSCVPSATSTLSVAAGLDAQNSISPLILIAHPRPEKLRLIIKGLNQEKGWLAKISTGGTTESGSRVIQAGELTLLFDRPGTTLVELSQEH